ncbi:MAG: glucokinase [Asticcacaulis sp.]
MIQMLVGDIGGTNARFALADLMGTGEVILHDIEKIPTASHADFESALSDYLGRIGGRPALASFALAGPVVNGSVRLTNCDWDVSAVAIRTRFGMDARIVNDFAAMARGVLAQGPEAFETLIPGTPYLGAPVVVLGPGTGLGQALVFPTQGDWTVLPTEGGHRAFAPRSDEERAVLAWLQARYGYISFERVVSGMGLENLYQALCALRDQRAVFHLAPDISAAAVSGADACAMAAAHMLAMILATFAGDAVLSTGARGGVYIAGGVAEHLSPFLRGQAFAERFHERGPMSPYLANVPVLRSLDGHAALMGAAYLMAQA